MENRESAYRGIRKRIDAAMAEREQHGGESRPVRLVAVSKRQPVEAIRALAELGQRDFGENYLQEALDKQEALGDLPLTWHFIGPIQSNKTRLIAAHFDWVHSVDRVKLVRRLGEQRDPARGPLNVLIQVNIDDEASKSGASPDEVPAIAAACGEHPTLRLRGLMCIPRPGNTEAFSQLAELNAGLPEPLPDLSMGMSGDFEVAIAEGATIVRVGTALFGPRD
ncbi:YggS family pyridoxal phosphate-dependent enzyme [Guyparkeria hydrothermalis]|uniref:YggS family pyridoxal phosphate-dependent enzyme n=1 Tax=Guyparkeria hydrothermalis TaxID=923 RepID=UPI002020E1EC|nr:YggS family pyridoxal phosphate-dependent enzyme [Guyparkeria hydrothermalis]MCL7744627.1 YggS family pyridoxal phosphate-dependent enzyme [Guyparkeria hydrothermalis]